MIGSDLNLSDEAVNFYVKHYGVTKPLILQPGRRVVLGDRENRVCRFCEKSDREVSFRLDAHAIPEALGNKSLFTYYECDSCNQFFGCGIENDLGNWSKPSRTFSRIVGKNGVPTLKKGGTGEGWRIEHKTTGFHVKQYENDPIFTLDEEKKQIRFELKRDTYTPVAVLKAFVKIGLTLLPVEELPSFRESMAWIRDPDHTKGFVEASPILCTFRPGPMPRDLVGVILLRRKALVTDLPYAFLVLTYGNHAFQVVLPSPKQDKNIVGKELSLPAFPTPDGPDPARYGKPRIVPLDLCGREVVRGERVPIVLGFDQAVLKDQSKAPMDRRSQP